jgi:23S rRNA pseudouridine1911/1915/1917 synthase
MHRFFAQRAVEKSYLALVHGLPAKPRGVIDAPIGATQRKGVYAVGGAGAKDAVTRYALDRHVGHAHALVRLWPHTGRTHQVRVHLAYLGTPIVGDALYGAVRCRDRATEDAFGGGTATRHALHCSAVRFRHPHTGTPCGMDAALPSDMKRLIAALEAGHEQDGRPVE